LVSQKKSLEVLMMGKTVPSYRMAVEFEINRWKGFKNALANEECKVAYEELGFGD
jgi:hypothetical protein